MLGGIAKSGLLKFVEGMGFEPPIGRAYFEWLGKLKAKAKGTLAAGLDNTPYACFVVKDDGNLGVANVVGLSNLLGLFDKIESHNAPHLRPSDYETQEDEVTTRIEQPKG